MLAPVTHIQPLTLVRRTRLLPKDGRVLVRQGQRVRATDVVATANLKPKHLILNVASGLGVSSNQADKYIERYMDDDLAEGDVIAKKPGLFSRVVRAPVAGKIVLITAGLVMLEEQTEPFELRAGFPGEITELVHNLGVVIEASGALVQCAWGNGRIDYGLLNVISDDASDTLLPEHIDVSMRGAILLAGHCGSAELIRNASEQRIRGMIFGSIDAELIPLVRRAPFPVVVTEGFGRQPMNEKAFRLLATNNKRDISLNAEPFDKETGARPEILIPLPGAEETEPLAGIALLGPGTLVRITRAPYQGLLATVQTILPGRQQLAGTLRLPAASVEFPDGNTARVPLANLEILS
jgi:hypothetical protein